MISEFISNPWVVGIIGGIISGIIVFFITKKIVSKKDDRTYILNIKQSNTEMLNVLKPYIADNGLPDKDIMNALISSTARKYGVLESEMYSPRMYCEELIHEIIGNVYVSSDKKNEYTNQLCEYIKEINHVNSVENIIETETENNMRNVELIHIKDRFNTSISMITALFTTALTVLTVYFSSNNEIFNSKLFINETNLNQVIQYIMILLTLIIAALVTVKFISVFIRGKTDIENKDKQKKKK